MLFMQKKYESTYKQTVKGIVKQYYDDLAAVINDQNEAIRATGFLKANNFGENDEYILNKDLDNDSISSTDLNRFFQKLHKRLKKDPKLKHLGFFFFASHGIAFESTQWIVLNQFDSLKEFYKLYGAENQIRLASRMFLNCYFITIFACCREIFSAKTHTNCIAANSK